MLYLVSYDIPTKVNASRDLLRLYLRSIGCGLLQESLWLAPYNPGQLLEEYSREHRIAGTILVSRLGHDGSVGQEKLDALLARVYRLDDLTFPPPPHIGVIKRYSRKPPARSTNYPN